MTERERIGDWFQTYTGRKFYVADPFVEDIDIEDIAHALSRICRYGGHCLDFYSVAQHSVMVSRIVAATRPELALHGLMHDAEEAYTGDMIRPLKLVIRERTSAFDVIAKNLKVAIGCKFVLIPLDDEQQRQINYADNVALSTERRDTLRPTTQRWRTDLTHPPLDEKIVPLSRDDAKAEFLAHFAELRA